MQAHKHRCSLPLLLSDTLLAVTLLLLLSILIRGELALLPPAAAAPFLLLLPRFSERLLGIRLPALLFAGAELLIFSAMILGELAHFYLLFRFWDAMLHSASGMLLASLGLFLPDLLEGKKLSLSMRTRAFLALTFAMTAAVAWEFFEFSLDRLFLLDMQKDSLLPLLRSHLLGDAPLRIRELTLTLEDGSSRTLPACLDPGLVDTIKDLAVTLLGASAYTATAASLLARKHPLAYRITASLVPKGKDRTAQTN